MRWWSSDGWFLWNSTSLILFDNVNVTWCERVHGNNQTACVGPLCKEWHWTKTRPGAHSNWQVSEVWEYGKCITHQQWDFSWDMMGIYPGRYHQKQNDTFIWAYQLSLTFPRFRTLDIGNLVNERPLPGCDDQGAGWRTVTFLGFLGPLWGSYSPPGGVASDSPGEFQFGGPFCTSEAMRSKSCWPFVHLTIRYYMILYVLNSHQSDGNMTTSIYKYLRVSTNIIK